MTPMGAKAITNGILSKVKAGDVLLIEVTQAKVKDSGIPQTEFQKDHRNDKRQGGPTDGNRAGLPADSRSLLLVGNKEFHR